MKECKRNDLNFEGKCVASTSQWSDKVRFYANKNNHTLITSEKEPIGKGWCKVRVGKFVEKQRGECNVSKALYQHYPDYKEVSTFTEDSYLAPKSGKVSSYGTHNYNLEYSNLKPIDSAYKVLDDIKSTNKSKFGKPLKQVQFHEWEYIVLNWKPEGDKIKLQVSHSISNPLTGEKKTIYESQEYDESDSKAAIQKFNEVVNKVK